MSKRTLWLPAALLVTAFCTVGPASAKDVPAEPKPSPAAARCTPVAIDLTNPAVVALLQNTQSARPVSEIRVETQGKGATFTRVARQDFEIAPVDPPTPTPTPAPTPTPIKTTVTCTSGTCLGLNCAVLGCDPFTVNGQTGCSPCSCTPVPPAITCGTNSCTCTKVTTVTPTTPASPTQTSSETTPQQP